MVVHPPAAASLLPRGQAAPPRRHRRLTLGMAPALYCHIGRCASRIDAGYGAEESAHDDGGEKLIANHDL
jgi:hypothetical protein